MLFGVLSLFTSEIVSFFTCAVSGLDAKVLFASSK